MSLVTDARVNLRSLLKQPGLALVAILALTLGIGLTTVMFSIIQGAFWRGLPFDNPERIVAVAAMDTSDANDSGGDVTQYDFAEWAKAQRSFDLFGAFYQGTINLSEGAGQAERVEGAFITANTFDIVGARPAKGRLLQSADEAPGAPRVVLLGHDLWQRRYVGDEDIVGRTIRMNGQPATIVGVMPPGFKFPTSGEAWTALTVDTRVEHRTDAVSVIPVGRLAPGVSIDDANAEFVGLAARTAAQFPDTSRTLSASVKPYINRFLGPDVLPMLLTMLGAVFGVLLIACANVANLLIARTAVRTKEIAIRTALGASRSRIIRQLLGESAILAMFGALGGLVLAQTGIGLFNRAIVDTDPPFWIDIRLDPTVLLFTVGLALIATLASGLLPALQASRADVNDVLKDETRGSSGLRVGRMSRALVVVEIALSCGLLVASGLAIKSIVKLKTTDFGFASADVFTARVGLFETDYPTPEARARFFADLQSRLSALPGIRGATIASNLPATGANRPTIVIDGVTYASREDHPPARTVLITPTFFETFGRQVVKGRVFRDADDLSAPRVAIVNESFVAKFFADTDPLGRRFRLSDAAPDAWITVVGVAPDLYLDGLENKRPEGFYTPLAQDAPRFASIAVRATGSPMALASAVRSQVAAQDANLPIYFVRTMEEFLAQNNWHYQVFGTLFTAFGASALFLATVGLYAVMAFSVSRRTQEIGVRLALGASGGQVMRLVLRQAMWQVAIGLVIGVALGAGLSQMLTIIMFGVEPWDLAVFSTVVVSLFATAMLACLIPARRALRVHPTTALRG
jgi:predicted permease